MQCKNIWKHVRLERRRQEDNALASRALFTAKKKAKTARMASRARDPPHFSRRHPVADGGSDPPLSVTAQRVLESRRARRYARACAPAPRSERSRGARSAWQRSLIGRLSRDTSAMENRLVASLGSAVSSCRVFSSLATRHSARSEATLTHWAVVGGHIRHGKPSRSVPRVCRLVVSRLLFARHSPLRAERGLI